MTNIRFLTFHHYSVQEYPFTSPPSECSIGVGITPQQQPGSEWGGDVDEDEMSVSLGEDS